jgi:hypothetical protein
MERVSRFLEAAGEPRSRNQIEQGVTGNATSVRQAIDVLCAEGHAEEFKGERGARMVQLLRAYREADEETEASSPADGPTSSQGGGSTPPQGHAVASESTSYSDSDKPADDDYVALVAHPPTGNGYSDDDGLERLAEQAPAAPVVWCGTCEAEKRFVVRGDLAYPRCGHQPLCAPGSSEGGAA